MITEECICISYTIRTEGLGIYSPELRLLPLEEAITIAFFIRLASFLVRSVNTITVECIYLVCLYYCECQLYC